MRTANTFLRGCKLSGAVDDATALIGRMGVDGVWKRVAPDVSALEYAGALCAQALRIDEAARLADRALTAGSGVGGKGVGGKGGGAGGGGADGSGEEMRAAAAARVRLAICRAAALCGAWARCIKEADAARALLRRASAAAAAAAAAPAGGVGAAGVDSHAVFRQHQREEALTELDALETFAKARQSQPGAAGRQGGGAGRQGGGAGLVAGTRPSLPNLGAAEGRSAAMSLLLRRALPLPLSAGEESEGGFESVAKVLDQGYGLAQWRSLLNRKEGGRGDAEGKAVLRQLRAVMGETGGARGRAQDGARGRAQDGARGRANDVFHSGGTEGADGGAAAPTPLNLHALFADEPELQLPEGTGGSDEPDEPKLQLLDGSVSGVSYRLELGCGAGEWLSAQAGAAPHVRWLALELRRDRAYV